MKKFLSIFVAIIIAIPMFLLVGCFGDDHTHTFAATYSYDATHHWYACKQEDCKETKEKAEHVFNAQTCTVCGYVDDARVTTTTYNFVRPSQENLSVDFAEVYYYLDTLFAPGNDMTIDIKSNNTFVLTLGNGHDFTEYETIVTGTFTEDGNFTIESAVEKQTIMGYEVYANPVSTAEVEQKMAAIKFGFVKENNYFILQNYGFNFVFVKEDYTPVIGEVVVANLPIRAARIIIAEADPTGVPYDMSLSDYVELAYEGGTYVCVDENSELAYAQILEGQTVSLNGVETEENGFLKVGTYRDASISLDLNETKTEDTSDDTVIPFVDFYVAKVTEGYFMETGTGADAKTYFPSYVLFNDTVETYLDRMNISYTDGSSVKQPVTSSMLTTFDLNYDGGKNAKLVFELPSFSNPEEVYVNEFIVPIIDLADNPVVRMYIGNLITYGEMVTVQVGGNLVDALIEQCYLDIETKFGYETIDDLSELLIDGTITLSTIDTSTPGFKTATLTYTYAEGKSATLDFLVVVIDEQNPIAFCYDLVWLEIDGDVDDAILANNLNNLKVEIDALSFDGSLIYQYASVDFNDLMGVEEYTTANVRALYDSYKTNFQYNAELVFEFCNSVYGNYEYTQQVTILFI